MTPSQTLLQLVRHRLEKCATNSSLIRNFYQFDGHSICIESTNPSLLSALTRAFAFLKVDKLTTELELLILIDSGDTVWDRPTEVPSIRFHTTSADEYCNYQAGSKNIAATLSYYDRQSGQAFFWIQRPLGLPWYEIASPFKTILNWWLTSQSIVLVHAATIGNTHSGILLVGKGGKGKTSTALTAFLHPSLYYLADDYVPLKIENKQVRAITCYGTAKVDDHAQERFPHLATNTVRFNPRDEKSILFPHENMAEKCILESEISAIVTPHIANTLTSSWVRISPAQALLALAPSTMLQLSQGTNSDTLFKQLTKLVQRLPSFQLSLGTDPVEIAQTIDHMLKNH